MFICIKAQRLSRGADRDQLSALRRSSSTQLQRVAHAALVGCAVLASSTAVKAQTFTFASAATGNDANNCTRAAPCLTLQRAVDVVAAGGHVQVLTSGAYGDTPLQINKSVTISADGVSANVRGISILSPMGKVALRGLHLGGRAAALGTPGIEILDAASVHIERCTVERFPRDGVAVSALDVAVFILDSNVSHNGRHGLIFVGDGANPTLTVDNSHFDDNKNSGMFLRDLSASLTRTAASANGDYGVILSGANTNASWITVSNNLQGGIIVNSRSELTLESSVVHGSGFGIGVLTHARSSTRLSNSLVTGNEYGVFVGTAVVLTRGNNTIIGNTNNVFGGSLTPLGGI